MSEQAELSGWDKVKWLRQKSIEARRDANNYAWEAEVLSKSLSEPWLRHFREAKHGKISEENVG